MSRTAEYASTLKILYIMCCVHFTNNINYKNNLNIKIMEHFTISIILNTVCKFVAVL